MDTNYEAVKCLIEILVKKAGYDINKNYSENELKKTKETISKLENNKDIEKATKNELIANLKIRQANWENNAEVIGKALLSCYKNNKSYMDVRGKVEFLSNLAKKDEELKNDQSLMSYVYSKLKKLENEYNELNLKIESNDYINQEEKDLDVRLKEYLINSIDNCSNEIILCDNELERLKDVEHKEQMIKERLNAYIANVKKDVELLDSLKKNSLDKGITLEVWEKIEDIELNIKEKLEKVLNILKKTDNILNEVNVNREKCNNKKTMLSKEIDKSNNKLNRIEQRLNNDDYIDFTKKIKDLNKKELIRIELNELKNKKDVIYVNVDMVKEELIREWSKNSSDDSPVKLKPDKLDKMISEDADNDKLVENKKIELVADEPLVVESNCREVEDKKEVIKSEQKEEKKESNKIELDW